LSVRMDPNDERARQGQHQQTEPDLAWLTHHHDSSKGDDRSKNHQTPERTRHGNGCALSANRAHDPVQDRARIPTPENRERIPPPYIVRSLSHNGFFNRARSIRVVISYHTWLERLAFADYSRFP